MAVPSRTQTLNTFVAATAENRRPGLVDNFFNSASLFVYLKKRHSVALRGGEVIKENYVYTGFNSSSYGRGDEFDSSVTEFATSLTFNWKHVYAPCNLDVIDIDLNDSPQRVFDIVEATMENAELSLVNEVATQIFADGTGNSSKDFDGLGNAVSQSGSYGGITRSSTSGTPGYAIRAGVADTTGGALSMASLNSNYGSCVIGREKPDLLVTTQTLWNRIWERSQPSERVTPEDLRDIGYEAVRFNGAVVTVDSHCPSGYVYFLNTKYFRMYVHSKWDLRFRGFGEPTNQQRAIGQLALWGNLICRAPRMQGYANGLT